MRNSNHRFLGCLIALTVGMSWLVPSVGASAGRTEQTTIPGQWNLTWKDIAADDDVLVIGAPEQNTTDGWAAGAVFVFRWDGFVWQPEQTLTASDAGNEELFGDDVDVDGDTVVVSRAPGGAYMGSPGTAYVFTYDGSNWTETERLEAPTGQENYFGRSVAVSGDRLAVGVAPSDWPHPGAINAVRVYEYDGSSWVFASEIPAPAPGWFGLEIDLDGDQIIVADPIHDDWAGGAFIYEWDGATWAQQAVFTGYSDGLGGRDELGSVAIEGDVAVAGGPCHHCSHGHAYVYTRTAGSWSLSTSLSVADHSGGDYFGGSVDIGGTTIAVGASGADGNRGAAYIFESTSTGWAEVDKLIASDGAANDYFGQTAIAAQSYVVVGYENDDAYVYLRAPTSGVDRLAGLDRYATAVAVSAATFDPGVDVAYLAVGSDFPDALTAGPLAAKTQGPILLTATDRLPSVTGGELSRLQPKSIVILGGTGVVSPQVATELESYTTGTVTRLAGADRYATAAAVSHAAFAGPPSVAYVAVGTDYPDALAGGPLAAMTNGPILLTETDRIPSATAQELIRLQPDSIVILGGVGVVSSEVEALLGAYTDGSVERIDGPDRYWTAARICEHGFGVGPAAVYVAVGTNFPDALAGVPAAALQGAPILLTRTDSIPTPTAQELTRLQPESIIILGGEAVVSPAVASQLGWYVAP